MEKEKVYTSKFLKHSVILCLKFSLLNEKKSTEVDNLLAIFDARGKNKSAPVLKKKNEARLIIYYSKKNMMEHQSLFVPTKREN